MWGSISGMLFSTIVGMLTGNPTLGLMGICAFALAGCYHTEKEERRVSNGSIRKR
jgi:hypothetical protein